jgi:hypothetical protein
LFLVWLSIWIARKRLLGIRAQIGLGIKLEQYAATRIIQFFILSGASFVLVLGFQLIHDQVFIGLFGISLVVFSVHWPTSRRVCRDLKLKGDEREMVLNKKDTLG